MQHSSIQSSLFIDGTWRTASDGGERAVTDPATGCDFEIVAEASDSDVQDAIAAAASAHEAGRWLALDPDARGAVLWKVSDLLVQNAEELARIESRDQGQPYSVAFANVQLAAKHFRYFAGWATKIEGRVSAVSTPTLLQYSLREPVGVCGLITPWNFPIGIASWKIAPALAAGNCIVAKPAEETPLSTIRLFELLVRAGVPDGVANLVTGGPDVGAALVDSPDVHKVSFTGSTEVGRRIAAASSRNMKRVTLELGGKTPVIVTKNADLNAAVDANLQAALLNSGQVCAAFSRFYVHDVFYDEFCARIADAARAKRVGPGLEAESELGPLVSQRHLDKVQSYIELGKSGGASLLTGGERLEGRLADGFFLSPAVFADVSDDMRIMREEIFGPVLAISRYSDEDEVIARANDSEYGLAAAVWSEDLREGHRLASRLRSGTVWLNSGSVLDAAAPWGGLGASGWGREMGTEAIDAYTETKSVWVGA